MGQPLFKLSRKGTQKLIMTSATSLLPSMLNARSGYKKQMIPSSQLSVAQSTLATTSAPRVWAANAVRTSHTTTSILKVQGRQWLAIFPASVTSEEERTREQNHIRALGSSTSHYFPFLNGTRTPYSCCLQNQSAGHTPDSILLHYINQLSRRPGLSSPGTFLSGKLSFLISVTVHSVHLPPITPAVHIDTFQIPAF